MQMTMTAPTSAIEHQILTVIAEATRYPREILDPAAELENDLGIDSVKRAEIWGTLMATFKMPPKTDLPQPRTIGDVINTMTGLVTAAGAAPAPAAISQPAPPVQAAPAQQPKPATPKHLNGALERTVLELIAETTRYPVDVLQPEAELENDLGIDSVKRVEIWSVLSQRLGLPDQKDTGGSIRTVADVVNRVRAGLAQVEPVAPQVAAPLAAASQAPDHMGTNGHAVNGHAGLNGHIGFNGYGDSQSPALKPAGFETNHLPFTSKRAFISGSGHGLGRVLANRLASLGAEVILNSFHSRAQGEEAAHELVERGYKASHIWGSMANPAQVNALFDQLETAGPLDFFISNASNGIVAPLDEVTPEHWDIAFRTNVVGLHQGALRAAKLMQGRGGRIIALSSPGASRCFENYGCMGPVKAALESLVRYLALHLGPSNILVNAVSAGPIYGDLLNRYPNNENLIPYWESRTPGGELVTEDAIADVVMFLLSPESRAINGSVLVADLGLSLPI